MTGSQNSRRRRMARRNAPPRRAAEKLQVYGFRLSIFSLGCAVAVRFCGRNGESLDMIHHLTGGAGRNFFAVSLAALAMGAGAARAQNAPAIEWRSMLNLYADDNGYLALENTDLVFAPAAQPDAAVVVKDGSGATITEWSFYPDYQNKAAVFARLQPENEASASFTPGSYSFEYLIDGAVVTRMDFEVKASTVSDDPFNPGSSIMFDGPWQDLGFFVFDETQNHGTHAEFRFWAGRSDLGDDVKRTGLRVEIARNGEVVGHTRAGVPYLTDENISEKRAPLLVPHEGHDPARRLDRKALETDGNYTITVSREEDGGVIRRFSYQAKGGKIVPLPRTTLGYKPHTDYIPPRTLKAGTTTYEFTEAVWVEGDN